jgi:hypothetical protein
MKRGERPFSQLPLPLLFSIVVLLSVQVLHSHYTQSRNDVVYKPLSEPFSASTYRIASIGSNQLMSYLLAIRLQLHDNQSGKHVRYEKINYRLLSAWLDQIDLLNTQSEYPTMLASRVYSQTIEKNNVRLMIDFIQRSFVENPQLHWRRMTEATILAKHKLGDLELALLLAEQLTNQPVEVTMPHWARDMQIIILSKMNAFEAGIAIIVALMESGSIDDPDEKQFLKGKLLDFQQQLSETRR